MQIYIIIINKTKLFTGYNLLFTKKAMLYLEIQHRTTLFIVHQNEKVNS